MLSKPKNACAFGSCSPSGFMSMGTWAMDMDVTGMPYGSGAVMYVLDVVGMVWWYCGWPPKLATSMARASMLCIGAPIRSMAAVWGLKGPWMWGCDGSG